jgi:hypothetical protein
MPQPADKQDMVDREHADRIAWLTRVRRLHRNKRVIGFAGIVLGASMLMWWKFDPTVPQWALMAGFGVLGVSWVLFVYVIVARWKWVKDHPYTPPKT